jgi:hypothetical protein
VNHQPTTPTLGGRRPRPGRSRWVAAAVLLLLLLLLAAGLLVHPWSRRGAAPLPNAPDSRVVVSDSAGIGELPTRRQAGVPVGWPHTRQGAVGAATGYARVLSTAWFLTDADRRRHAVTAMAAPEARPGLQAAQDGVAAGVAKGPFGAGLANGARSLLRTSLLGYRVDRYAPADAQVALWAVVVYGNDSGLAPQALYATSTLRLRWVGDWKLLEAATVPGPVPVQGQATPSPAGELVDAAESFKEFDYAPAS